MHVHHFGGHLLYITFKLKPDYFVLNLRIPGKYPLVGVGTPRACSHRHQGCILQQEAYYTAQLPHRGPYTLFAGKHRA